MSHGKSHHDVKVKGAINMIDELINIKNVGEKFINTHRNIELRLSSQLWQETVKRSSDGKFNSDILLVLLESFQGDAAMKE